MTSEKQQMSFVLNANKRAGVASPNLLEKRNTDAGVSLRKER